MINKVQVLVLTCNASSSLQAFTTLGGYQTGAVTRLDEVTLTGMA